MSFRRNAHNQRMCEISDLEERRTVWLAFSDLFLDTDVTLSYAYIVDRCASSKYSIDELEIILKNEVTPACSSNLHFMFGEWVGFDEEWLQNRIIKIIAQKNTLVRKLFGMFSNSAMDKYVNGHWNVLSKRIQESRKTV